MSIILEECDPLLELDELVELFIRAGKPRSREMLEWYYQDQGFGLPNTWCLRELSGKRLLGAISVLPRRIRCGERSIKVGLIGNLLVDADARNSMGAIRLFRATQSLVSSGSLDLLLGNAHNPAAVKVARSLRFQAIGVWANFAYILRSRRLLKARKGWQGAIASPIVDAASMIRRLISGRRYPNSGIQLQQIAPSKLIEELNPRDWSSASDRLVGEISLDFLSRRYVSHPETKFDVLGLYTPDSDGAIGCIVSSGDKLDGKTEIYYCGVNRRHAGEEETLYKFVATLGSQWGVVTATLLEGSDLATNLSQAGFIQLPVSRGESPTQLMGFWSSDDELSSTFGEPDQWALFRGFFDV